MAKKDIKETRIQDIKLVWTIIPISEKFEFMTGLEQGDAILQLLIIIALEKVKYSIQTNNCRIYPLLAC